jgi:hypothetical protein
MLKRDIYRRRFLYQLKSQSVDSSGIDVEKAIDRMMAKKIPPSVAVQRAFTPLEKKRAIAVKTMPKIIKCVCDAFGVDELGSGGIDSRDICSITAWIAVNKNNIRPHSVIREKLNLASNSMVNHHVDRCERRRDESVLFSEKFNQILAMWGNS